MKKTTAALVFAALLGGSLITASANAAGGGHFHGGHGGHFHGAGRVGVFVGVAPPLFYSPFYYPRYYYPPAVVVPGPVASAPAYIEQPALGEAGPPPVGVPAATGAYWYYCRDSQTYYPYVQECASPWDRVAPNSAPPG